MLHDGVRSGSGDAESRGELSSARPPSMPDRDNGRLQNELGWPEGFFDRGNLLRFLDMLGANDVDLILNVSCRSTGSSMIQQCSVRL